MSFALPKCNGEDFSKWTMCEASKEYSDGRVYTGEWKKGLRHGNGTSTFPDGSNYTGKWKNDFANGFGIMINIYNDGSVKYEGNFKNGFIDGSGSLTLPDGRTYSGNWVGTMFLKIKMNNGKNAILNGYSGTIIEGEFKDSEIESGNITSPIISTDDYGNKYVSTVTNGKLNGKVIMTWSDGSKYVGQVKNDQMHGIGTFTDSDGKISKGKFINGFLDTQ